jgi:hypothetical protein
MPPYEPPYEPPYKPPSEPDYYHGLNSKNNFWYAPFGAKSGFGDGDIFRSGRKTGKKSIKREYPILTGLQLLGKKESGEESSIF